MNSEAGNDSCWRSRSKSDAAFSVEEIDVVGQDARSRVIDPDDSFVINMRYVIRETLPPMRLGFQLCASDGTVVVEAYDSDDPQYRIPRSAGHYCTSCTIPGRLLRPGTYALTVNAGIPNVANLWNREAIVKFMIQESQHEDPHRVRRHGLLQPRFEWQTLTC